MKSAKQLYLSIKQLQFNKEIMRQSYEIKRKAVIFSRKEETDGCYKNKRSTISLVIGTGNICISFHADMYYHISMKISYNDNERTIIHE